VAPSPGPAQSRTRCVVVPVASTRCLRRR
jgi:hypothetical protein